MHIPDGFLAVDVWLPAWLVSAMGLWLCIRKTSRVLKERLIPLMGVMSAFIFAGQMLNFPVLPGVSGHFFGGALAAVMLGPYAAAVSLSCVLIVQCILFQDGGLTALGANILNMSFVGSISGYFMYRFVRKVFAGDRGIVLSAGFAAWVSVVLASFACVIELSLSGVLELKAILPVMTGIHMLIGIGEAVITGLVVAFILKARPDLIYEK